jgi:HEAT repeat protein
LSRLGSDSAAAIPALLLAIKDDDYNVRSLALDALLAQDPVREEVVGVLVELARGKEQPGEGVNALARFAARSTRALQALCEILLDESAAPVPRRKAAEVAGDYKLRGGIVVSTLVRALEDEDYSLRCAAVDSLRKLEARGETVVKALTKRLREDSKAGMRLKAAHALGEIGLDAASAAPSLREALTDADAVLRRATERALQRIEGRT